MAKGKSNGRARGVKKKLHRIYHTRQFFHSTSLHDRIFIAIHGFSVGSTLPGILSQSKGCLSGPDHQYFDPNIGDICFTSGRNEYLVDLEELTLEFHEAFPLASLISFFDLIVFFATEVLIHVHTDSLRFWLLPGSIECLIVKELRVASLQISLRL